jgi:hypothetical protein
VKSGDTITVEHYADSTWSQTHVATLSLSATHYAGLFLTSNLTGQNATAVFTSFQIQQGGRISTTLTPVTPGSHTYTARWADNAGTPNVSADGVAAAVTVSTPADSTAPTLGGAPTGTASGETTIAVTWPAATDAVSGVRGYLLESSATSGSGFSQVGSEVATTSAAITGLTAETTRYFRYRAVDNAGNVSAYSAEGSATTDASSPVTAPASAPANPSFVATSTTGGAFTAETVTDATYYRAWRNTVPEISAPGWAEIDAGVTHATPSFAVTGLTGTEYVRMRAGNAGGTGPSTSSITATPQVGQEPPSNLVWWYKRDGATPTPINTPIATALPTGCGQLAPQGVIRYPVLSTDRVYPGDTYSYKSHLLYTGVAGDRTAERVETRIIPGEGANIGSRNYPSEMIYRWSIYLEPPYPIDTVNWEIHTQWHTNKDDSDNFTPNPTISWNVEEGNNHYTIWSRYSGNGSATAETKASRNFQQTDGGVPLTLIRGAWDTWVMHIRWHWDNTGFLHIYRNNFTTPIISRTGLSTTYNNEVGPYNKVGCYKKNWYYPTPSYTPQGAQITERLMYHARWWALRPAANPGYTTAQLIQAIAL